MRLSCLGVVVGGVFLIACSVSPAPSSSSIGTLEPGATGYTRPIPTPSPYQGQAVNGLVTYPGDPVTFEYPAAWQMITGGFFARHYEWFEAVLGTGAWRLGCTQSVDSNGNVYAVSCGDDALTVGPGQVVVMLLTRDSPAFLRQTAPPEAVTLDGSLRYTTETSGSRATWRIYGVPNSPPLEVIAEFGDQPSDQAHAQVQSLVDSIRLSPGK